MPVADECVNLLEQTRLVVAIHHHLGLKPGGLHECFGGCQRKRASVDGFDDLAEVPQRGWN